MQAREHTSLFIWAVRYMFFLFYVQSLASLVERAASEAASKLGRAFRVAGRARRLAVFHGDVAIVLLIWVPAAVAILHTTAEVVALTREAPHDLDLALIW